MKQCKTCLQTRDFIAFYRNRHEEGGYEKNCKLCYNKHRAQFAGTLKRSEKTCSHCRTLKPISDFYQSAATRDGHGSYCKPCVVARNRKYREDPKVQFQSRLAARVYRETQDPEERNRRRREYYRANRERIRQKEKLRRENLRKLS